MAIETRKCRFNWRGFFSLLLFSFFVLLSLSGVVLYAAPQCWVADETGWAVLGLSKDQWTILHMSACLVVLVASGFHLYYNWAVFWAYIRKRREVALNLKREMALVVVLSVLVLFGTVYSVPPFSTLLEWSEAIDAHWRADASVTQGRHGRASSVPPPDEDRSVPGEPKIGQGGGHSRGAASGVGQGYGRMTVQQLCASANVPVADGLERLREAGIEALANESLRAIAQRSGKTPSAVAEVVQGERSVSAGGRAESAE
ncbi:MAG TPA: DUF4405 domain-containing protein [Candidatus Hydrogenedentes bacterium]|nr:DUF4405 domain-containing protein [Candidatus Hydrogenedentota bacterium]